MGHKIETHSIDELELDQKIAVGDVMPAHIPRFASTSEIVKYQFCNLIIKYKKENNLKQKDIAEIINVDKSEVSKLFSYDLKKFSGERIFGFVDALITSGADLDLGAAWNAIKKQSSILHAKLKSSEAKSSKGERKLRA